GRKMKSERLRYAVLCGIVAPVLWLSLIVAAGSWRPDFNHITHYISELGERGSATEIVMRAVGFGFTGFLYVCFASLLPAILRDGWRSALAAGLLGLEGLGRMGAGVFPCEPGCEGLSSSQELHHLFATIGFLSGVLASIAWGIVSRRLGWPRGFALYSVASGVAALIFLLLMSWRANPLFAPGLFEHLATAVLSAWLLG